MAKEKTSTAKTLTGKQIIFAQEFVRTGNQAEAARAAGYSNADRMGNAMLDPTRYPLVTQRIVELQRQVSDRATMQAADIVEELQHVGRFNPQDLLDGNGKPIPIHKLPPCVAKALDVKITTKRVTDPDTGKIVEMHHVEYKALPKMDALQQLSKHLGLLQDIILLQQNNTTVNNTVVMDWAKLTARTEVADPVQERIKQLQLEDKRGGK